MQIYVTFVPNLTSSKVCLLPYSALPSFTPPSNVSTTLKENADLHKLKKCETTALSSRNGLLLFAFTKVHSMTHLRFENSAGTRHFNTLIGGAQGWVSTSTRQEMLSVRRGKIPEGLPSATTQSLETDVSTSCDYEMELTLFLLGTKTQGWGHLP